MRGPDLAREKAELCTVAAALLAEAKADAAAWRAEAERAAETALAEADARAGAIRTEAASAGRADARRRERVRSGRTRRRARQIRLSAQREVYEDLGNQVRAELARQWGDGGLRRRLADCVQRALGPDAELAEAPKGGVIGRSGDRCVDLSLDALAARAVASLGGGVRALWTE